MVLYQRRWLFEAWAGGLKGWDDESRVMGKAVICCEPGRQYEEIYLTLGVKALWLYHYKGPAEPDAGSVIWPRTIHSWLPVILEQIRRLISSMMLVLLCMQVYVLFYAVTIISEYFWCRKIAVWNPGSFLSAIKEESKFNFWLKKHTARH